MCNLKPTTILIHHKLIESCEFLKGKEKQLNDRWTGRLGLFFCHISIIEVLVNWVSWNLNPLFDIYKPTCIESRQKKKERFYLEPESIWSAQASFNSTSRDLWYYRFNSLSMHSYVGSIVGWLICPRWCGKVCLFSDMTLFCVVIRLNSFFHKRGHTPGDRFREVLAFFGKSTKP